MKAFVQYHNIDYKRSQKGPTSAVNEDAVRKAAEMMTLTELYTLPPESYSLKMELTLSNTGNEPVVLPLLRVWAAGIPTESTPTGTCTSTAG